jgi:2-keto-4-pentenoate hydratase/2-oxohepta-3-ene-1,7-dioic acid hydratase in catechol pathway
VRFCTYRDPGARSRPGRVEGDAVVPLESPSLLEVIGGHPAVDADGPVVPVGAAELLAPYRPPTLLGVGLNYRAHAAETGKALPRQPLLFAKLPGAVAPPFGEIARPHYTSELDYEGELAVVIGREARDVGAADALAHVFGYTVMNDVSARDRQREEPQWIRAKGGDGFAPFGPWVVTADEVADPQDLRIRTWVNGELRQDGSTEDMVFSVAELVSWCSRQFTLRPGDMITTGTPAGVGAGYDPPRFLAPGDVVRVEIEGIGRLEHRVVRP